MKEIRTISQLIDALSRGERVTPGFLSRSQAPYKTAKHEQDFCISVAGHVIAIHSLYPDVFTLCKPYICDSTPDFHINITNDDIAFEGQEERSVYSHRSEGYLETLAVYRKICDEMLTYGTFLMHGAAVAVDDSAYLFSAPSGTGKTTHIKKWLKQIDGAIIVNGDKPLIKITDNQVLACGTPWCGKEKMGTNTMVTLKAIVLMERGEDNAIEEISYGDAYSFLIQQTYWPSGLDNIKKTLELLSKLNGKVRFFRFVFNNMKDDALSVSYQALIPRERGKHEGDHEVPDRF